MRITFVNLHAIEQTRDHAPSPIKTPPRVLPLLDAPRCIHRGDDLRHPPRLRATNKTPEKGVRPQERLGERAGRDGATRAPASEFSAVAARRLASPVVTPSSSLLSALRRSVNMPPRMASCLSSSAEQPGSEILHRSPGRTTSERNLVGMRDEVSALDEATSLSSRRLAPQA